MKQKMNARQKREAEALRRKGVFAPTQAPQPGDPPAREMPAAPPARPRDPVPAQSPEEDTLEFLAYLEKHGVPAAGKEAPRPSARKPGASGSIPRLNLEDGMPLVSEALDRMHMGLQEMRVSRVKIVKLIHGYGSTGRGGRIGFAVREDLAGMKRKHLIQDYIPGEDFGPMDPASRRLAERDGKVPRDPDYGRMNHGITLVVL